MELQVRHLSKTFGSGQHRKEVLRDISFALRSGEFLSLVGSSGSGKSTILRLIAGLEQPSSGQVLVDGQAVQGPGPDRGMVFQKYSLYPWLSAAENVAFGMRLQGLPQRDVKGGPPTSSRWWVCRMPPESCPVSSRAECNNGSPSPAPWRPIPRCCSR